MEVYRTPFLVSPMSVDESQTVAVYNHFLPLPLLRGSFLPYLSFVTCLDWKCTFASATQCVKGACLGSPTTGFSPGPHLMVLSYHNGCEWPRTQRNTSDSVLFFTLLFYTVNHTERYSLTFEVLIWPVCEKKFFFLRCATGRSLLKELKVHKSVLGATANF